MHKNPAQTEATKQAFVDAFCLIAAKKSLSKISVRELAEKAGYNRCTFYQYFNDVYELLTYIEDILIADIHSALLENLSKHSLEDSFLLSFAKIHQENANYYNLLAKPKYIAAFQERLKSIIIPAVQTKLGLTESDTESIYSLDFYFSGVIAIILRWLRGGRNVPTEKIADLIRDLSNNGIWPRLPS